MKERIITREYLTSHPNEIIVFGDNRFRRGTGGAAILRNEPNVYSFITKKTPSPNPEDYFAIEEYRPVFEQELNKLVDEITKNRDKTYLVSRIGGGIANRYGIFEQIIEPLPAPLGPMIATFSPGWMAKETLSKALMTL